MWNPISIEIHNLFAHKNSTYEFKNNTCTVIFGDNKDDKGLQNNGAGKTTLFEAVCIALTNESLRGLKKESFINREADDCKIIFCLENSAMKMKLRIERQFFRGSKPAKIAIYENGELNSQIVSVNEANKRVLELIGISREDLLRYFIISQDNHYTFFTASDSEKKEIMNRITSADMVNPVIDELNERLKLRNDEYNDIIIKIDKLSDRRELLAEQRQELLENSSYEEEIKNKRDEIKEAEGNIIGLEEAIRNCENKLQDLESDLSKIKIDDTTELINERKRLKKKFESVEDQITENNTLKRKLKREVDLVVVCPHCNQEFIPDTQLDNLSPEEIRGVISELENNIEKQMKLQSTLESKLKDVRIKIGKAESFQDKQNNLMDEKKRCERKMKRIKEEKLELQYTIGKLNEDIRRIQKQKKENTLLKKIETQIKDVDKELSAEQSKLKPIQDEIDMIKFWQFNMGKNGFSTYLANKSIKIIEGITNSFLRKFGVDISVLINGFKILRSGEVREKIDVFVLNDGITAEQFMSKSGGERGRVTLAGILGIQHLINLSTNGRGLNFLALDESLNNIDKKGIIEICKTLNGLNITTMLIAQNVEDIDIFQNKLYVEKNNGESNFIQ
jgi:DNA repair exonuclease SbcCD ATPase subunit